MSTRKAKEEEKRRLLAQTDNSRTNGYVGNGSSNGQQSGSSSTISSIHGSERRSSGPAPQPAPPYSSSTHQTMLDDDNDAAELDAPMSGGASTSGLEAVGRALATRGAQLLQALPQPPLPTLQSLRQQPLHADDPILPIKCAIADNWQAVSTWHPEMRVGYDDISRSASHRSTNRDPCCERDLAGSMAHARQQDASSPPPRTSHAASSHPAGHSGTTTYVSFGDSRAGSGSTGSRSSSDPSPSCRSLSSSSSISATPSHAPSRPAAETDVLIPVSSSCDGSSSSSPSAGGWTGALPEKLRGMMRLQQIEPPGDLARPMVQGSLLVGYCVAILFLLFMAVRFMMGRV